MELSNSLKQRFIKDWKLPFQVVQEPFFSYAIETLDSHFNTVEKLKMLTDIIETLGTEEDFFSESNRVKTTLIDAIQAKPSYTELQADRLETYETKPNVSQKDIYNMENVNKTFISLDLVKANFNVMRGYNSELTLGYETYEEMVSSVTGFDYFKKSKYLRQVIFGNMLPKKQQKLQKFVMSKVISMLHEDVGIAMEDFVSASADEVVFAVDPTNVDKFVGMVSKKLAESALTSAYSKWVRVEAFTLKSIGNKKFFVKENCLSDDVDFKGIPSFLFMQVFRKYTETPETKLDRTFYHEGFMASFDVGVFDENL